MISQRAINLACEEIARIFREEREASGLSMSAVAESAGLSQQMVSYVEKRTRKPSIETLLRLSWALDLDPADVLRRALK